MFLIPGNIIALLTFPGVIVHEWAHELFCKLFGVKVHKVVYFRLGNPAGYVEHEAPRLYKQIFWISIGPLLVNTILTILISFIATQTISEGWVWYILLWLAFSIGMHSFPSDHDMQHISLASKYALKNGGHFLYALALPFVWLVWVANKLRFFWFDAIYAFMLISLGGGFNTLTSNSVTPEATVNQTYLSPSSSVLNQNDEVIVGEYRCSSFAAAYSDTIEPSSNTKNQIDSEKISLDMQEERITSLFNNINNDYVDEGSQSDINRHNLMVDSYNSELTSFKHGLASYNSEIDTYNAKVDIYNSYLKNNCTHI